MTPICPSIFVLLTFFAHLNHDEIQDKWNKNCFAFKCNESILNMMQGNSINCLYRDSKSGIFDIIITKNDDNDTINYHILTRETIGDLTLIKVKNESIYIYSKSYKEAIRYESLKKNEDVAFWECVRGYPIFSIECDSSQGTQEKLLHAAKQFEDFQEQEEKKHFNSMKKNYTLKKLKPGHYN